MTALAGICLSKETKYTCVAEPVDVLKSYITFYLTYSSLSFVHEYISVFLCAMSKISTELRKDEAEILKPLFQHL